MLNISHQPIWKLGQEAVCEDLINSALPHSLWHSRHDLDEFIFPTRDDSVASYILKRTSMGGCTQIKVPRLDFGSGGFKKRPSVTQYVIETYFKHVGWWSNYKSMVLGGAVDIGREES